MFVKLIVQKESVLAPVTGLVIDARYKTFLFTKWKID